MKSSNLLKKTIAFASCASLLIAAPVHAQDYIAEVNQDLDEAASVLAQDGFMEFDANVGELALSAGEYEEFIFTPGENNLDYAIAGACDYDCGDVDLYLYYWDEFEQTWFEQDSDVGIDPFPVVYLSGDGFTYAVHVYVANCSVEPCHVGMAAFKR